MAVRISVSIAASSAYKVMAKKIGVSSGVSSSGIGTVIGLSMLQGVLQRSSLAARRLRAKRPKLYRGLQEHGNLQLLYFIIEKPMQKHVQAIPVL